MLGRSITGLSNNITLNGATTVAFDHTVDLLVVGAGGGGADDAGGWRCAAAV
jgi:hypothetical protein